MGGFWQVFVLFGLHWGFVPLAVNEIATQGHSLLFGPLVSAVFAQAAATLAVFIRTRNSARREVAGPAVVSGFLAGVTEPGIYGVNLPLKKPFYFGIAGGVVGGAIATTGGSASTALALPSLLTLPMYAQVGSFTLQLIGTAVAVLIAFTLTFFFASRETAVATTTVPSEHSVAPATGDTPATAIGMTGASSDAANASQTNVVTLLSPVDGSPVPLTDVGDKVFASEAMGKGLGVLPTDGHIYAPISGTVKAATKSGHAYGIKSTDGVEVLVHIGIDTVHLDGRGFRPAVSRGDQVQAGDLLAVADLDVIAEAGYDSTVLVVVTNTAQLTAVAPIAHGAVVHGNPVVTVQL